MIDWKERFDEQLKWTKELRNKIFDEISFRPNFRLLEVGCGTGALLKEIAEQFKLKLYGIDIDENRIEIARENLKQARITANLQKMDILSNLFKNESFDFIATNYLFLWIKDLRKCFEEMHRILKENGILFIFAEPDYGGLVEFPESGLRAALISNLRNAGADPEVARKLNQHFPGKFDVIESFCASVPWISNTNKANLLKELDFFQAILKEQSFNYDLIKESIETEKYSLFLPIFSYFLMKT